MNFHTTIDLDTLVNYEQIRLSFVKFCNMIYLYLLYHIAFIVILIGINYIYLKEIELINNNFNKSLFYNISINKLIYIFTLISLILFKICDYFKSKYLFCIKIILFILFPLFILSCTIILSINLLSYFPTQTLEIGILILINIIIQYIFTFIYINSDRDYYYKSISIISYFFSLIVLLLMELLIKINSITTNIIIYSCILIYNIYIIYELYVIYNYEYEIYYKHPLFVITHIYMDIIFLPYNLLCLIYSKLISTNNTNNINNTDNIDTIIYQ